MSEHFRKYIKKEHYPNQPANLRFKTSFRNCIYEALKRRTWKETDHETEWDIFWTEKEWIHDVMDHMHLGPTQRVNHFRNYYELCRKDNLIKNLKRHKRNLEKEGKLDDAAAYNFFPTTYTLPGEYSIFCEEFKKNSNHVWIMKPIGRSQGKGIFLFNKLSQVSQWKNDTRWKPDSPQVENYIVQRYINNPLLIGGKKFDMRIYCLVTSYSPLVAYLYRDGFARFTHHRYDSEDITNTFVHLTNVAIQKTSENYDEKLGGKWDLRTLKLYLMSQYGQEAVSESFANIQQVIIRTLQSVQKVMINDKHCFELYGFDILLDSDLKPWLIEVNGSPSMTANTTHDFELKCNLLDDVFTIIDMEKVMTGQEEQIGGFDLICKGTPVKNESSLFSTMLSCHNNRAQQLKKLAKMIASKLAQSYNQEKEDGKKTPFNKDQASISTNDTIPSSKGRPRATSKASTNSGGATKTTKAPPPLNKQNTLPPQANPTTREPREAKELNNPKLAQTKTRELSKGKTFVGLPPVGTAPNTIPQNNINTSSYASNNATPANGSSSNAHRMSSVVNSTSTTAGANNLLNAKHRLSQPIQGGPEKIGSPSSMKVPSTLQLAGNATLGLGVVQGSDNLRSKGTSFTNSYGMDQPSYKGTEDKTERYAFVKGPEDIIDRLAGQDREQKKSVPRSDNSNSNEEDDQKRNDIGQNYATSDEDDYE